jgi:hypothetical protein
LQWDVLALGVIAILALLGALGSLPAPAAFFAGSIGIILFPGLLLAEALGAARGGQTSLPERLAMGFVLGSALLAGIGFVGSLFHVTLNQIVAVLLPLYVLLLILVV